MLEQAAGLIGCPSLDSNGLALARNPTGKLPPYLVFPSSGEAGSPVLAPAPPETSRVILESSLMPVRGEGVYSIEDLFIPNQVKQFSSLASKKRSLELYGDFVNHSITSHFRLGRYFTMFCHISQFSDELFCPSHASRDTPKKEQGIRLSSD